jgi:hypothetical protein
LNNVTVVQLDYVAIQLRIGMLSPALAGRSARALRALAPAEGRGRPEPHRLRASVIPIVWVLWIGWGMFNMECMLTYRVFILRRLSKTFSRRCTIIFSVHLSFSKTSDVVCHTGFPADGRLATPSKKFSSSRLTALAYKIRPSSFPIVYTWA